MLEVRKGAGRLERVVHDRGGGHGLDLVIDGGQLLVVGDHELGGGVGDVRIGGQHHRDRLAHIMHLVEREDRLIVERRAVERLRHHGADVLDGHHPVHAGKRAGGLDVDRADTPMRDRAAHDLAVEHAGQPQIVHVFGAARDLGGAFETADRAPDLSAADRPGCHQCFTPARSRAADQRAPDIDAHQLALVGGRSLPVRDGLRLIGGGIAGAAQHGVVIERAAPHGRLRARQPDRLLGRGADHDRVAVTDRRLRRDRARPRRRAPANHAPRGWCI